MYQLLVIYDCHANYKFKYVCLAMIFKMAISFCCLLFQLNAQNTGAKQIKMHKKNSNCTEWSRNNNRLKLDCSNWEEGGGALRKKRNPERSEKMTKEGRGIHPYFIRGGGVGNLMGNKYKQDERTLNKKSSFWQT